MKLAYELIEWVNPLVVTQTKDGKIRIYLEPTEFIKNILRQHHSNYSQFWGVVSMYAQCKWKNSKYVTFFKPFDRFRFQATEIFRFSFHEIFGDLEGVIIIVDVFLGGKKDLI